MRTAILILGLLAGCASDAPGVSGVAEAALNARDDNPGACEPGAPCTCECPCSPLIVDVGDGVHMSGPAAGVPFEVVPGRRQLVAWPMSGAWLTRPGENGRIDDGSELFGDRGIQDLPAVGEVANGFGALAMYDRIDHGGNGDGEIGHEDAVYTELALWSDRQPRDGVSDPSELMGLAQAGLHRISLSYYETGVVADEHGNELKLAAPVVADDPIGDVIYDVWFTGLMIGSATDEVITSSEEPLLLGWYCEVTCWNVITGQYPDGPYEPCYHRAEVFRLKHPILPMIFVPAHAPDAGQVIGVGARLKYDSFFQEFGTRGSHLAEARSDAVATCKSFGEDTDLLSGRSCQSVVLGDWPRPNEQDNPNSPVSRPGVCRPVYAPQPTGGGGGGCGG